MEILSMLASVTSIIINLYTLFTIRKSIGAIAQQGADKVKDKIEKLF